MSKEVLVVLGSPNSASGELSIMAKERVAFCFKKYKKEMLILCTGGFGKHFNISNKPHAFYLKKSLIKKGISEEAFLKNALSENTVDDAVKVKEIISSLENINLTVITSEYHLERVKLVFNTVLKNYQMNFCGVKTNLEKEKLNALIKHEKKAIEGIVKRGLYY